MVSGKTLLQSFKVFYAPKKVCILLKKQTLVVLHFLTLPYFFITSYTNMNSDDHLGFIGPN